MSKTPALHQGISNRIYEIMRVLNGRKFTTRQLQFAIVNYHKDVHNGYEIPRVASIVASVLQRASDAGHFTKSAFRDSKGHKHNVYSREPDYGDPTPLAERLTLLAGFIKLGWLTEDDIVNTPWKFPYNASTSNEAIDRHNNIRDKTPVTLLAQRTEIT